MSELKVQASGEEDDGLFLTLLLRWARRWKAIAVFVTVMTVLAGTLAYFGKKSYTAYQVVVVKGQKSSASALLSSIGAGNMASLIGAGDNGNLYAILSLAQSRELAKRMIAEFQLDTVWELKKNWKAEDGRKKWLSSFQVDADEFNPEAISLKFTDRDPARAAKVVSAVTHWLDSAFTAQEMAQTEKNLDFISGRVERKTKQLDSVESELLKFVRREKMAAPDERMILTATKMAELEVQKEKLEIEGEMAARMKGRQSSERALIEDQKRMLLAQIRKLDESGPTSWAGAPLGKDVERRFAYERIVKKVERHGTVLRYLVQQQEMLQIDAQKDVPVLTIVDPVAIPQKKSAPKVGLLVQLAFSASLALALVLAAIESELLRILGAVFREGFGRR